MDNPPEIIENGKLVSQERIDPNVASFIMQAAQTAQLVKLRKLEESKIPIGAPSYQWTVTTTRMEIQLANPWISFSLVNNGPGSIRMAINTLRGGLGAEATIINGQTVSRDFEYPIVTAIYLVAVAGTASVVAHAEEGEWA